MATLRRNGLLPWRQQEEFGNLRRAFEGFTRETYGPGNAVLFAAVMSHYIQDAHQPLHASVNYDGQMTGNNGIHARFETALFEAVPVTADDSSGPADADPQLARCRIRCAAIQLRTGRSDPEGRRRSQAGQGDVRRRVLRAALHHVRPILEQRLGEAITATAGLIMGAWQQAGSPC
jgi:hypothetical protein